MGGSGEYVPGVKTLDLGVSEILPFEVPAEDRNRTSPFPYGGARFEFRAVGRIDSGVEAIHTHTSEKNVSLFEKMNVMSKEECESREVVLHDHYAGTVEMEALCLVDMINQHIIPSVKAAGVGPLADLEAAVTTIKDAVAGIHAAENSYEAAKLARVLRLETMIGIRETCDSAEEVVPASLWTLATYKELLFLDSHVGPALEEIYED